MTDMMKPLNAIVAHDRNRLIGADGGLPWRYPEDLKFFKATTMGHAIIHGRKSYEDFGKPLPGRRNIIVTRQEGYQAAGCEVVHDIDAAIALAYESDAEPFILGGAEIYRVTMPLWTRLFVTEIDADHQGDTYFPEISNEPFIERESRRSDILNFRTLVRQGGPHDV